MQLGMIGLGRMGANMVRRLLQGGIECVVFNRSPKAIEELVQEKAVGATDLKDLTERLMSPRAIWLMIPAAAVDETISTLLPFLEKGDTSGGVWGLQRGYCMMIGGENETVAQLDPIFKQLAPGADHTQRTPGRANLASTAELGYLHCGPSGAGHFVKMVHNGIEYGVMAAYAEGLGVLREAGIGKKKEPVNAETAPLRDSDRYQYDLDIRDIAEVWRHGSVIASWLLDLTATALVQDPALSEFAGRVSDSGEGRWTINAAIDEGVPVPVLSAALYQRFSSRGNADYQDRILSAMRFQFGGHIEIPKDKEAA